MIFPKHRLDPIDELILTAFSITLAKLDSPLPKELQQQINQVGEALAIGETDVIADLEDIAKQNERLNELYNAIAKAFQQHYQTQERNKSAPPPGRKPLPPEDAYMQNFLAADDINSLQILRATDPKKAAEEQLKQAEGQGKLFSYSPPASYE